MLNYNKIFSDYPANYPPRDRVVWAREIGDIETFNPDEYLIAGRYQDQNILKLNNGTWTRGRESR